MRYRDYSVRVLNSKKNPAEETAEGYVPLEEGEQYTLLLNNLSDKDAVAMISIDGKDVAHVKVGKQSKLKIDAPANSDQQFTFYRSVGEEGKELFEGIDKNDLGLVQVQFVEVPDDFQYKSVTSGHTTIYIPYYDWWRPSWRPVVRPWWETYPGITYKTYTTLDGPVCGGNAGTITCGVANATTFTQQPNLGATYTSGVDSLGQHVTTAHTLNVSSVSGGTGLSGIAKEMPVGVEAAKEKFDKYLGDHSSTTIKLRLIWKMDKGNKPSKLMAYSTPTPPPLD